MDGCVRLLIALATALGASVVPAAVVVACSCATLDFDQAVRDADVAIVGTLVETVAQPGGDDPLSPVTMTWAVERSRDPISSDRVKISAWYENGANCGVTFATGERWLVLAYSGEDGLETNGCMANQRLGGDDHEAAPVIEAMLPAEPTTDGDATNEAHVPSPVILGGIAVLILAAVSVLAFARPAGRGR